MTGRASPWSLRRLVAWCETCRPRASASPVDGGPPLATAIAIGGDPTAIAIDEASVYWIDAAKGAILKCPKQSCTGGPVTLAQEQNGPRDLAVDDKYVYWTNTTAGTVARAPK